MASTSYCFEPVWPDKMPLNFESNDVEMDLDVSRSIVECVMLDVTRICPVQSPRP